MTQKITLTFNHDEMIELSLALAVAISHYEEEWLKVSDEHTAQLAVQAETWKRLQRKINRLRTKVAEQAARFTEMDKFPAKRKVTR